MIFNKVKSFLATQLEIDPESITEDTDIIADLGADSLDVVELIMALEDEYGIVITDESIHEMKTVGDISAFIEKTVVDL